MAQLRDSVTQSLGSYPGGWKVRTDMPRQVTISTLGGKETFLA